MALPTQPVTLSVQEVQNFSQHFSFFRHDANNSVGLISAAAELMRYNPAAAKKWSVTLVEQPPRIAGKARAFVSEAERILGIRDAAETAWYRDMWARSNAPPTAPAGQVQLSPGDVEAMHQELLNLHKELTHLAFTVSGSDVIAGYAPAAAREATAASGDQLGKVMRKFSDLAALFEKNFGVKSVPHRLLTGVPATPVALSQEEVALFQRRLGNLEHDIHEHLGPLLELSRIARVEPDQLQMRAGDLAPSASKIATVIQQFGAEFDKTFKLQRGG